MESNRQPRRYTRWTRTSAQALTADLLGMSMQIEADPLTGIATVTTDQAVLELTPDEARLYGVRLIEAAALADAERSIRDVAR